MDNRIYTYRIYTEKGVIFGGGFMSREEAEKSLSSHTSRMKRIRQVAAGIVGVKGRKIRFKRNKK